MNAVDRHLKRAAALPLAAPAQTRHLTLRIQQPHRVTQAKAAAVHTKTAAARTLLAPGETAASATTGAGVAGMGNSDGIQLATWLASRALR